jgi:hypothetical protein
MHNGRSEVAVGKLCFLPGEAAHRQDGPISSQERNAGAAVYRPVSSGISPPKTRGGDAMAMQVGETYRCEKCGAEVQVTKPCPCPPQPGMHSFKCCGQEMKQVQADQA